MKIANLPLVKSECEDMIIFTHNDLDGCTSKVLWCAWGKHYRYSYTSKHCTYDNIDSEVMGWIKSSKYNQYSVIVIVDISVSVETLKVLNKLKNPKILIDHHNTAIDRYIEEDVLYDWVYVNEGKSASFWVYKYMLNYAKQLKDDVLHNIVSSYSEQTKLTDLWDAGDRMSEVYVENKERIDRLLSYYNYKGMLEFCHITTLTPYKTKTLSDADLSVLDYIDKEKKRFFQSRLLTITGMKDEKFSKVLYAVTYADRFKSELAEHIFENNSNVSFVFIIDINGKSLSLRRNSKFHLIPVDLEFIAKQFNGGGGHKYAAGASFDSFADIQRLYNRDFEIQYDEDFIPDIRTISHLGAGDIYVTRCSHCGNVDFTVNAFGTYQDVHEIFTCSSCNAIELTDNAPFTLLYHNTDIEYSEDLKKVRLSGTEEWLELASEEEEENE